MSEKSILEMVGGEKHINPHYNIKAEKIGSYWKKDKSKMTEEEINKKAEIHCNEVLCNAHEKCNEVIKCRDWRSRRAGFFCGYEQALKDFEKENAELKADNEARKFAMAMSEKVEKQLREENKKAKEIIKILLKYDRGQFFGDRKIYEKYMHTRDEAEQFLKE